MNKIKRENIKPGKPAPFGVTRDGEITNFALVATEATSVSLCLFDVKNKTLVHEIPLTVDKNKTGQVWHIAILHLETSLYDYSYRITPKFHPDQDLINDPYAKIIDSSNTWGSPNYPPLGKLPCFHKDFDWGNDRPPQLPLNQLIIYEMHVRGFTHHRSSLVSNPGTFLGVIDKIPYLLELGINAIECLPIQEFNEMEYLRAHPDCAKVLYNYWGYSTVNFFCPMNRYATSSNSDHVITEFKTMVKALHSNGIEIILDVVFNHTAEGDERGPVMSFKGLGNSCYYLLDKNGQYHNFSGCGNSLNANHPIVHEFIIDVLRYWVTEMHVDGFRFDLASALTRDINGEPQMMAPLIQAITHDPILSHVKLISEPWDCGGLYQVGTFAPETLRWSEWNGKYRDSIRQFIKGTPYTQNIFSMRICGSEDLYHPRNPCSSINFITSHDGFSLADLVSYNTKHNLANGEDNRDGSNDNDSWNCGVEGETSDPIILQLRDRQMKNFHLALMISQGVPMLAMGDEYAHTKLGNNNTWCQDNELNWFLWDQITQHAAFHRFYKLAIQFRKDRPYLRRTSFLTDKDIFWHGMQPYNLNWHRETPFVAFTLIDHDHKKNLYVAFNSSNDHCKIQFPEPPPGTQWVWLINTANPSPFDFFDPSAKNVATADVFEMVHHSAIVLELESNSTSI